VFLTAIELAELTHKRRRDAQVRALRHMGIEHKIRPDGTPLVLKSHIDKSLGGITETNAAVKAYEPNWDAVT
jgi:hypothetical protein